MDRKKIILTSLFLFIITLIITLAVFRFSFFNSSFHEVKMGTIIMNYSSEVNGINLDNSYPITDEVGINMIDSNNIFTFTVMMDKTISNTINYEVTCEDVTDDEEKLDYDDVRLYLERSKNIETYDEVIVNPTEFYTLSEIDQFGAGTNEMVLDSGVINKDDIYYYRLKMWLSEDYEMSSTVKSFAVKVNVYGTDSEIVEGEMPDVWLKTYSGNSVNYTVEKSGVYKIELWGASGSSNYYDVKGGTGSYTSGEIFLSRGTTLSVNIGSSSGYNGGGSTSTTGYYKNIGANGGGATDVRFGGNALVNRIMVAGGGGGAGGSEADGQYYGEPYPCGYAHTDTCYRISSAYGGLGGGSYAGSGGGASGDTTSLMESYWGGYSQEQLFPDPGGDGSFGQGGNGTMSAVYKHSLTRYKDIYSGGTGGGGGGGYFGGGGGAGGCGWWSGAAGNGGGGSSYISGHLGSIAITSSSDLTEKCSVSNVNIKCSYHFSKKKFNNTLIIDGLGNKWSNVNEGEELMPRPSGGYYSSGVGHTGNGYARISFVR